MKNKLETSISSSEVAICGAPPASCLREYCQKYDKCDPTCVKQIIRKRKLEKIFHPIRYYKREKKIEKAIEDVKKNIENGLEKIKKG